MKRKAFKKLKKFSYYKWPPPPTQNMNSKSIYPVYLSSELVQYIYSFDPTWRKNYNQVINEIVLRYDDGKWWLKGSQLHIPTKNGLHKELNFLTYLHNDDLVAQEQDDKLEIVHEELREYFNIITWGCETSWASIIPS